MSVMFYVITPILYSIAATLNITCSWIFTRKRFKKNIYKYLTANSIIDAILMLGGSILLIINSMLLNEYYDVYWLKIFHFYVIYYLLRVCFTISSLISIKIAFDRCLFISTQQKKHYFHIIMFSFVLFSFVFDIPHILLTELKQINFQKNNETTYNETLSAQQNGFLLGLNDSVIKNQFLMVFYLFIQYAPNVVSSILIVVLNTTLILKIRGNFKQNFTFVCDSSPSHLLVSRRTSDSCQRLGSFKQTSFKSRRRTSSKTLETRITWMVVCMSTTFLISQISMAIGSTLFIRFNEKSIESQFFVIANIVSGFILHTLNFIFFYIFDKRFKYELISLNFKCKKT